MEPISSADGWQAAADTPRINNIPQVNFKLALSSSESQQAVIQEKKHIVCTISINLDVGQGNKLSHFGR